ncbi:hypothetical protein HOLleu_44441 [Holothuria leucospilota]|uniref:Uncharacterized protein n=1 Tax=Holothuria leucospilota TaxID=206669 RepID=A0A9Q0Y8V3_HOLLE|nr:hypothetical protein HOLleu_44441 [Holothuria leucospilota]
MASISGSSNQDSHVLPSLCFTFLTSLILGVNSKEMVVLLSHLPWSLSKERKPVLYQSGWSWWNVMRWSLAAELVMV